MGLRSGTSLPVLTPAQAADLLQCGREKVYRLLEAGHMPGRKVGGSWRIVTDQLMDWLEGARQ